MADWIDSYKGFSIDETELDRLFQEYDEGRISKRYLLGLFGMDEKDFDHAIDRGAERQVNMPEVIDG
jgi:hypothetical protein